MKKIGIIGPCYIRILRLTKMNRDKYGLDYEKYEKTKENYSFKDYKNIKFFNNKYDFRYYTNGSLRMFDSRIIRFIEALKGSEKIFIVMSPIVDMEKTSFDNLKQHKKFDEYPFIDVLGGKAVEKNTKELVLRSEIQAVWYLLDNYKNIWIIPLGPLNNGKRVSGWYNLFKKEFAKEVRFVKLDKYAEIFGNNIHDRGYHYVTGTGFDVLYGIIDELV